MVLVPCKFLGVLGVLRLLVPEPSAKHTKLASTGAARSQRLRIIQEHFPEDQHTNGENSQVNSWGESWHSLTIICTVSIGMFSDCHLSPTYPPLFFLSACALDYCLANRLP